MLEKTYFQHRLCWAKPIPSIGFVQSIPEIGMFNVTYQSFIWDHKIVNFIVSVT